RLSANEVLFAQGDDAKSLFIVVEGRLRVSLHGGEGLVLRELGPGALVGEIALLAGGKRSATGSAAEPSVVLGVTQERLETLRKANPAISDALTRALHERMRWGKAAGYLRDLLGDLDPKTLAEIERRVAWVHLGSGEELFRQGDASEGAYIVALGRLRVTV